MRFFTYFFTQLFLKNNNISPYICLTKICRLKEKKATARHQEPPRQPERRQEPPRQPERRQEPPRQPERYQEPPRQPERHQKTADQFTLVLPPELSNLP